MSENKPPIPDTIMVPFLDKVANDEVKLALSGLFLTYPQRHFTGVPLATTIQEHFDDRRPYEPQAKHLISFCSRNLQRDAAVVIKEREGLIANPEHLLERMALVGLFGRWSLRWQDFSVQQIYGPTKGHSSSMRHAILGEVYEAEKDGRTLYVPGLTKRVGGEFFAVNGHVKRLVQVGILSKDAGAPDYEVRITDTHSRTSLEGGSREIQAFYAAVQQIGIGVTSVLRLVDVAKAVDPTIDEAKLNIYLRRKLPNDQGPKGIQLVTSYEQDGVKKSSIRFAATARTPLRELIAGIGGLSEKNTLGFYAGVCGRIIKGKVGFSSLLEKGVRWSPNRAWTEGDGLRSSVLAIIRDHPNGITGQDLERTLREDAGAVWSRDHIDTTLGALIKSGKLRKEHRQKNSYTKRQVNFYVLNSQEDQGQDDAR